MRLTQVSAELLSVPEWREQVLSLLVKAIDKTNSGYTLRERLRNLDLRAPGPGRDLLWAAYTFDDGVLCVSAVCVTQIVQCDDGALELQIILLGGHDVEGFLPLIQDLEQWAASRGATKSRIYGRKGWTKHLSDYRITSYIFEKPIHEQERPATDGFADGTV